MTSQIKNLPWMDVVSQQIVGLWNEQKLPHALCIHGQSGMGQKHQLAYMAALLLCENKQAHQPCGLCRQCKLFINNEHPDIIMIQPAATTIGIDQIRQLSEFVIGTAFFAKARIVMIDPLEQMTTAAANALLKLLEEPPPNVYFLVATSKPSQLMPTIRSRLQFYAIRGPEFGHFCLWLQDILTELDLPKPDHEILYHAYILAQQGPFLALDYILTYTKSDLESIDSLYYFKHNLKQSDLISEYIRFKETIAGPPNAVQTHLGVLIKALGLQYSFLFFDIWLEQKVQEFETGRGFDEATQQKASELWDVFNQVQVIKENLIRSPQLNKVYLERELLYLFRKVICVES